MAHASSAQGNHVAFPECQEIAQLYLCPLPNSVQGDFKTKESPFLLPSPGPEGWTPVPQWPFPPGPLCPAHCAVLDASLCLHTARPHITGCPLQPLAAATAAEFSLPAQ